MIKIDDNVIPVMNDKRIVSSKDFPIKTYCMLTVNAVQFRDMEENTIRYFPSDTKELTKIKRLIKARTGEVKLICSDMKYSIKRNTAILEDVDTLIIKNWLYEDIVVHYNQECEAYIISYGYEAGFQYINLSKDTLIKLLTFHNDNVLRVYLTFTRLLYDGQFKQVTREYLAQQIGLQVNDNTLKRIGHITDTLHALGLVEKRNTYDYIECKNICEYRLLKK